MAAAANVPPLTRLPISMRRAAAPPDWAAENRKGSRGEHRYTPEDFKLSEGELTERFADYVRHFGIEG